MVTSEPRLYPREERVVGRWRAEAGWEGGTEDENHIKLQERKNKEHRFP